MFLGQNVVMAGYEMIQQHLIHWSYIHDSKSSFSWSSIASYECSVVISLFLSVSSASVTASESDSNVFFIDMLH